MKYRIIKKAYRGEEDKIKFRFYIQEFSFNFWGKQDWRNYTEEICGYGDCYISDVYYSNLEDAQQRITNLLEELPKDEIIN